jgi:hypothetical protein
LGSTRLDWSRRDTANGNSVALPSLPTYNRAMIHVETTQPNMEWYIATSLARNVLPRCPFTTVDKCPRYYQSVLIISRTGRSAELDPDENSRLFNKWKKTDVWPAVEDDFTSASSGGDRTPTDFSTMCPEVSFERFGWFASQLIAYGDESEREAAHRRLAAKIEDIDIVGINPDTDWKWSWRSLSPCHYTECPLYAPLSIGIQGIVGKRKRPIGFTKTQQASTEE